MWVSILKFNHPTSTTTTPLGPDQGLVLPEAAACGDGGGGKTEQNTKL